ncbi:MAG: hypothetical protein GX442_00290 [Candidatus Riflebacteria bacterium]|nr:hypothetical protein [Candidatus Riflebacteria bacterium]
MTKSEEKKGWLDSLKSLFTPKPGGCCSIQIEEIPESEDQGTPNGKKTVPGCCCSGEPEPAEPKPAQESHPKGPSTCCCSQPPQDAPAGKSSDKSTDRE